MHKVVVDRSHAMVSMTASGFFSEAEVERAAADLHAAIRSLGDRVGRHVTLYDFSDLNVATAAVLERFARYFADPAIRPLWARRVALVHRSALLGLQMQRVAAGRDDIRAFDDRQAAIAWLLADQDRSRTISQPTAASG